MKTFGFIFSTFLIFALNSQPVNGQNREEREEKTEREIRTAINSNQYTINIDRAYPMKGSMINLTSNYSLEIRNDSIYSYLPYFGRAYSVPYGGGKGLIFNEPLAEYKAEFHKKGKVKIQFTVKSEGDTYIYRIIVYPNASASVSVTSLNRQSISFNGVMKVSGS